jgi:AcrR family transcriptional regulator
MSRKPTKSEQTLAAIIDAARELALKHGLHNLSLNAVATKLDISKSGVFVRAGSLENLQILVLESYERAFSETVFEPAMRQPKGLPRLNALVNGWIHAGAEMKALIISHYSATAYEDISSLRDSALKSRLLDGLQRWRDLLAYAVQQAVHEGHLRGDTEPRQLVFELFGIMSAYLYDTHRRQIPETLARVNKAYARLMSTYVAFPDQIKV